MVRKKMLCMFMATLLSIFMFGSVTVFATESAIPDATSQFYINDFANIISDEVEKEMQERAVELAEGSNGIQVVVTTVQTIGNADPVYYTTDMYNKYEIGKNNMGVLIMLSVETRDIQIRQGHNMTKYLSDRMCGNIIDDYGITYLANNEFEKGLYEMQKATIEHIAGMEINAESEVAVPNTESKDITNSETNPLTVWLETLVVFCYGILFLSGIRSLVDKRKEKKVSKQNEIIENSDFDQNLKQKVNKLEMEIEKTRKIAETTINENNRKITDLTERLHTTEKMLKNLEERREKAIMIYPDLEEKIDAVFAKEKQDSDKAKALEVENSIRNVLELKCTRQNLNQFEYAYNAFQNLSEEQQEYIPTEFAEKIVELYSRSSKLQKEFEEAERIRYDKKQAEHVQRKIAEALTWNANRHTHSSLSEVCNEYNNLTDNQKKYVTADILTVQEMKRKAKRLKDEHERNEHLRRQRENEVRRSQRMENSSINTSHRSYSGFGGRSGGHGAGRKF